MAMKTISVKLPEATYGKLKRAAELTERSVDEVLSSTLDAVLVTQPDLPRDLLDELAAMNVMSDSALFLALSPSLTASEYGRLQHLNDEAHDRQLTQAEEQEQDRLLESYQHSMLRRAQAMAILHQRGHELSREVLKNTMLKAA